MVVVVAVVVVVIVVVVVVVAVLKFVSYSSVFVVVILAAAVLSIWTDTHTDRHTHQRYIHGIPVGARSAAIRCALLLN